MRFDPVIERQQQQVTREELARSKQAMTEIQHHYDSYELYVHRLQTNISTEEDSIKYASCILELNRCRDNLKRHISAYNELLKLVNVEFPTTRLSEQTKKEIYHLYHSGRYNQDQLASQYGVGQSTISKIVTGSQPS